MSRRVVLGKYLNGTMGLKVSRPGFDALTDDDSDPNKFSFNSQWTNIVPVHQVGIVGPNPVTFENSAPYSDWVNVAHNLGYIPFIDARAFYPQGYQTSAGDVIWDDYRVTTTTNAIETGNKGRSFSTFISLKQGGWISGGNPWYAHYHRVMYVIYRYPVTI